jgi:putative FmdB family regulatory protein
MPIYEYRCQDCGQELEKLQRMSDDPLVDCPACGKPALKRLVSAAGFRLKGGGWYETDFKSANKRNLAGSDSDGSSEKKADKKGGDAGKKADAPAAKSKGDKGSATA